MKTRIIPFALFILLGGCEKIIFSVDNPISGLEVPIVLMHRGSGDHQGITGNTYEAAEYGLSVLDGVELDIQLSEDGTLWLDHDNEVHDCDGNVIGCFQDMTDEQITVAAECNGVVRYHKLEPVFQLMVSEYPNSYISLDIKGQYCKISNTPDLMRLMAQSVLALVDKYDLAYHVLVESNSLAFMEELDNQALVGQCVISLGDIDQGIANARGTNARGISLKYGVQDLNNEVVSLIHKKGYGLVVWVINEPKDIEDVWRAHPDFIQTDNADFKNYIPGK
jgi:glycerophosphoryl diester phosphodiesterase